MRAFLAVLIVFASVSAEAHKKRTVRKVMLSARATSTGIAFDVAMWMRIGGHHARRTILRFDLDKSGDLNAGEAAYLGNELAPKALGGLYLIVDGQPLAPVEAKSNARLVDDQTVEVMTLLSYTLDGDSVRTFQLAWRAGSGRSDIRTVEVSASPPLIFLTSTGLRPAMVHQGLSENDPFEAVVGPFPQAMNALIWTLEPRVDGARSQSEGNPSR